MKEKPPKENSVIIERPKEKTHQSDKSEKTHVNNSISSTSMINRPTKPPVVKPKK